MRESDFDLYQALVAIVEQLKQNKSLHVHWEIDLPPLPLQTSHQIYCIVKEGLINIQKHAHATQVQFRVISTSEEVILELQDNGRGFDPPMPDSGFGLRGIQERVQTLGGELTITSDLGLGTKIQVILPR